MRLLRLILQILVTAFRRLASERGPEAAASMSFFAVFSLFPLLLLLVAVGSSILDTPEEQERLLDGILRFLPVSRELVRQNVMAVARARGTVGWIGGIGLLWAASSGFGTLVRNLNRAWPCAAPRHLLGERLLALLMVVCLVVLVLLYLAAKALVAFPVEWAAGQRVVTAIMELVPSEAALAGFIFVVLTMLYRWLPRTTVLWREAAAGAAASALVLWGATSFFTRLLASGFARYNLIYGSLGTLLALLSWVFIASLLVLWGAHLGASIAHTVRHAVIEEGEEPAEAATVDPCGETRCDEEQEDG